MEGSIQAEGYPRSFQLQCHAAGAEVADVGNRVAVSFTSGDSVMCVCFMLCVVYC